MADYKKMYCELMQATEFAIEQLIDAQIKAEEIYMSSQREPLLISRHEQRPKEAQPQEAGQEQAGHKE